jgi:prophage maintenance system killer protein
MCIKYPDWEFYKETHKRMLQEFGGYPGLVMPEYIIREAYKNIIQNVRNFQGDIYDKGGYMLKNLRTHRMVEDGQKRTAYTVTASFLEINGGRFKVKDIDKVNKVMKDLSSWTTKEVIEWIKNGTTPKGI